ncbi:M15 family metallopeptidase [Leucobacter sp. HY1910]
MNDQIPDEIEDIPTPRRATQAAPPDKANSKLESIKELGEVLRVSAKMSNKVNPVGPKAPAAFLPSLKKQDEKEAQETGEAQARQERNTGAAAAKPQRHKPKGAGSPKAAGKPATPAPVAGKPALPATQAGSKAASAAGGATKAAAAGGEAAKKGAEAAGKAGSKAAGAAAKATGGTAAKAAGSTATKTAGGLASGATGASSGAVGAAAGAMAQKSADEITAVAQRRADRKGTVRAQKDADNAKALGAVASEAAAGAASGAVAGGIGAVPGAIVGGLKGLTKSKQGRKLLLISVGFLLMTWIIPAAVALMTVASISGAFGESSSGSEGTSQSMTNAEVDPDMYQEAQAMHESEYQDVPASLITSDMHGVKEPPPSPPATTPADDDHSDPNSLIVVINKQRPFSPLDWEPSDLRMPAGFANANGQPVRSEAADAAEKMHAAAQKDGVTLTIDSGYRPHSLQVTLYESYIQRDGQEAADTYSARPGHSEHQTGLVIDFGMPDGTCSLSECFEDTTAGQWLRTNGWKYGFILRYERGEEPVTGYIYEPWHYRYIGEDAAKKYHDAGATTLEKHFNLPAAPTY